MGFFKKIRERRKREENESKTAFLSFKKDVIADDIVEKTREDIDKKI